MGYFKIQNWFKNKKAAIFTRLIKGDFGAIGKDTLIYPPFHSNNASQIYIGNKCMIYTGGWMDTWTEHFGKKYNPRIDIGDNTYIGFRCHIGSCNKISIGKDVMIADNVYISDLNHGYEDVTKSMFYTPLVSAGPVIIEDEVWIGERVCILPNVRIGKHSIIGCNAVVTKDVPPYSIVGGIPAKVIKQYNQKTGKWEKA